MIPWAWGVNACASVVAAIGAALFAVQFGFNAVIVAIKLTVILLVPTSIMWAAAQIRALKRGAYALHVKDRLQRYEKILSLLPASEVNEVFKADVLPSDADTLFLQCVADLNELMSDTDELGGMQFLEIRSTLPDELLMYADKLSMAHGLEGRVPYLDREIVEWVERLDASFKVRRFSQKWIHRNVCRTVLPDTIMNRKKQGFGVNVVDDWFRDSAEAGMNELLLDPSSLMFEFLELAPVARLLKQHVSRQQDNHKMLFSLVVFEQWLRQQRSSTPRPASRESVDAARVLRPSPSSRCRPRPLLPPCRSPTGSCPSAASSSWPSRWRRLATRCSRGWDRLRSSRRR